MYQAELPTLSCPPWPEQLLKSIPGGPGGDCQALRQPQLCMLLLVRRGQASLFWCILSGSIATVWAMVVDRSAK